ncbi:MAG: carboxypeptidase-like regulatory domain-containing protein [Candidatus Solibacter sp.]
MLLWPETVASQSAGTSLIEVVVLDQSARPLRNVLVQLKMDADQLATINTDVVGQAAFVQLRAGRYETTAQLEGFELGRAQDLIVSQSGPISVELTLISRLIRRESLEVRGTSTPLEGGAASPVRITARSAKVLPNRNVADPASGLFVGLRGRRFTADFDVWF